MSDQTRKPTPADDDKEVHVHWDEHGHGRPAGNQAEEEELARTARPVEPPQGEGPQRGRREN